MPDFCSFGSILAGIARSITRKSFRRAGASLCLAVLIWHSSPASAQETAEALLAEATALYEDTATAPETLVEIREILDRIIREYPASDVAVQILLRQTVGGLDVAAIETAAGAVGTAQVPDTATGVRDCLSEAMAGRVEAPVTVAAVIDDDGRIAGLPHLRAPAEADEAARRTFFSAATAIDGCAPFEEAFRGHEIAIALAPGSAIDLRTVAAPADALSAADTGLRDASARSKLVTPTAGTEATMTALDLDRAAVRDLQARLLVAGHDPNGIDGLIGPGTRGALEAWQAANGIAANGFLNDAQLELLEHQTDADLAAWLEKPQNVALHTPPSPIALGPGNISGTWQFTSRCGSGSRLGRMTINGAMAMQHAGGNRYSGQVRNSQGLRGRFSGQLNGRQVTGETNWGLLIGRVRMSGRVADRQLIIRGSDSNGCSFYASKSG